MEIKDIVPFVLLMVLCGMLLGTGILVLNKFNGAVRTTGTFTDTAKNLSTGSTLTLSKTYCIAITSVGNGTATFSLATNNVTLAVADTCVVTYSPIPACTLPKCNITYTYGVENSASTATTNTVTAITPIATTWLSLIVTVAILSIILGLVINSFAGNRK